VRQAFLRDFRPVAENHPPYCLLVLGGSGGARAINEAVMRLAGPLLEAFPDWEILHQAGAGEFERLNLRARHARHTLVPFLEQVDEVMESASLLVSRAGASTCAELLAAGRGAILVPLPTSANDHQLLNAQALADSGRAVLQLQGGDFPDRLEAKCRELLSDREARIRLGGTPVPNRTVGACLEDLARIL
jgi:UDP-N-acetylglucosamine--N-acetylmuramyl-(pentapeptide) pyrophosphoryl-undecaprenol N-acetylglucosamine transferase